MNLTSVTGKKWIFKKFDTTDINEFAENHYLNEIIAKLLAIRKKNITNMNFFLNPTIKNQMPNPLQLKDMEKANFDSDQKVILPKGY